MDDIQKKLEELKAAVNTAKQEVELAVMFHETWRPTAYDTDLHVRLGKSFASHSFLIIRMSLRRELLLALTRLWDKNKDALRMSAIADRLRDQKLFEALVQSRSASWSLGTRFAPEAVKGEFTSKRDQILSLINKYSEGGKASKVLKKLRALRNQHLAHRQLPNVSAAVTGADVPAQPIEGDELPVWATDEEVEEFYQDNLKIVRLLLNLVYGLCLDFSDVSGVYKQYAKNYWASVRGEHTEGHPNYRPRVLLTR